MSYGGREVMSEGFNIGFCLICHEKECDEEGCF